MQQMLTHKARHGTPTCTSCAPTQGTLQVKLHAESHDPGMQDAEAHMRVQHAHKRLAPAQTVLKHSLKAQMPEGTAVLRHNPCALTPKARHQTTQGIRPLASTAA